MHVVLAPFDYCVKTDNEKFKIFLQPFLYLKSIFVLQK